jgi:hypothetical protein
MGVYYLGESTLFRQECVILAKVYYFGRRRIILVEGALFWLMAHYFEECYSGRGMLFW